MAGRHAIMGSKANVALAVNFISSLAYAFAYSPADVTTFYTIANSGTVNADNATPYTWLLAGVASDYEVRADYAAAPGDPGTVSSGAIGTWQSLGTSRSWTRDRTSNFAGVSEVILDMQVRRVSDSVVIDTFQVTINAEVV